jgi:MSHA biogenesis protein MshJ
LKKNALSQELAGMQDSVNAATSEMESDPTTAALAEEAQLKGVLRATDTKIAAASAELLPPRKMVEVIHDVLKHHPGVVLVSLKNEAVRPLVTPAEGQAAGAPYVHPVELIVEGSYLDVLAYLRSLEALPWQLHWQSLELKAQRYPLNRVRIELNTISMEKEWLGV